MAHHVVTVTLSGIYILKKNLIADIAHPHLYNLEDCLVSGININVLFP